MSGPELAAVVTSDAARWLAWEPLAPSDLMTLAALALAAWGLWQMRTASTARNRQIDAQSAALERQGETLAAMTHMLDERTAALTHGLETIIERTASGAAPGKDGTV